MSSDASVLARMAADWNERAGEDAHYYVAFGRRNQDTEEFFATGAEQVRALVAELRRLPPAPVRSRRFLEIGCGPGRLMRPMAAFCGEIHGVDISDAMVAKARRNLSAVAHAHPHHAPNSDLAAFASDSFDLAYSYAVFQHIPSREVVFGYLAEALRVLKPGGILRAQVNGLPEAAPRYDTWSGVRIPAGDIRAFASEKGAALLALEGVLTQYMWVTMRKPPAPECPAAGLAARIRRITNAHSSEPFAPAAGRFAALSIWVEGLPAEAEINRLRVEVGGLPADLTYVGRPERDGMQQLNVLLPAGLRTGLSAVRIHFDGGQLGDAQWVRLLPAPPVVPRLVSIRDGVDLVSGARISSGLAKATIEELLDPEGLEIEVAGQAVAGAEWFCIDPRVPTYEVNFRAPEVEGMAPVEFRIAGRVRLRSQVEIAGRQG